jgi:hypothetical protein
LNIFQISGKVNSGPIGRQPEEEGSQRQRAHIRWIRGGLGMRITLRNFVIPNPQAQYAKYNYYAGKTRPPERGHILEDQKVSL